MAKPVTLSQHWRLIKLNARTGLACLLLNWSLHLLRDANQSVLQAFFFLVDALKEYEQMLNSYNEPHRRWVVLVNAEGKVFDAHECSDVSLEDAELLRQEFQRRLVHGAVAMLSLSPHTVILRRLDQ